MAKVKMTLSLGNLDRINYGLPSGCDDGKVVEVDERQEQILVKHLQCAVPVDGSRKAALAEEEHKATLVSGSATIAPPATPSFSPPANPPQEKVEPAKQPSPVRKSGGRGGK